MQELFDVEVKLQRFNTTQDRIILQIPYRYWEPIPKQFTLHRQQIWGLTKLVSQTRQQRQQKWVTQAAYFSPLLFKRRGCIKPYWLHSFEWIMYCSTQMTHCQKAVHANPFSSHWTRTRDTKWRDSERLHQFSSENHQNSWPFTDFRKEYSWTKPIWCLVKTWLSQMGIRMYTFRQALLERINGVALDFMQKKNVEAIVLKSCSMQLSKLIFGQM